MSNTVKFDPGIGDLTENFAEYADKVYSYIYSLKSHSQKSSGFKMYAKRLEKAAENNIAFYAGCLLWAYFIKTSNEDEPKEIQDNPFLNMPEEYIENYDYNVQTEFMSKFFDAYERDYKYYGGKKYEIPEIWREILDIYSEFLKINKGFVKTGNTSDLKLPDKIAERKFDFDIEGLINTAISEKNLSILLKTFE